MVSIATCSLGEQDCGTDIVVYAGAYMPSFGKARLAYRSLLGTYAPIDLPMLEVFLCYALPRNTQIAEKGLRCLARRSYTNGIERGRNSPSLLFPLSVR